MVFKTILHPAANHPPTYMEQFCKALHPDLEIGKVCVAWFRQAIKHCTVLLSDDRTSATYFWRTVKNFIFPDRTTEIMPQKVPLSVHPKRLSVHDCQSLFLDIVNDYGQWAPRYAAESAENRVLWQVLYSLFGLMVLGTLFLGTVYAHHRYGRTKNMAEVLEKPLKPQERMQAIAARSLRLAKTELRTFKIKQLVRKEDIVAVDGSKPLILQVGTKYEFLESIVQGSMHSVGKLHRVCDQHDKAKTEFKTESINKALKFLGNDCQKLHIIVMFEDNNKFEIEEVATKQPKKALSPPTKNSSRSLAVTPRQNLPSRLEGGSARQKQSAGESTGRSNPGSKQPSTLRLPNTPRSSSGIPRSDQKALPSASR